MREKEKRMRKFDRMWDINERDRRKNNLTKWDGRENNLNPVCDVFPERVKTIFSS